jgi:hypothetical protein
MDAKKWKEADGQVPTVAEALTNVAGGIDEAAAKLEKAVAQAR